MYIFSVKVCARTQLGPVRSEQRARFGAQLRHFLQSVDKIIYQKATYIFSKLSLHRKDGLIQPFQHLVCFHKALWSKYTTLFCNLPPWIPQILSMKNPTYELVIIRTYVLDFNNGEYLYFQDFCLKPRRSADSN